jgi:hypothetical protein
VVEVFCCAADGGDTSAVMAIALAAIAMCKEEFIGVSQIEYYGVYQMGEV